MEIVSVEPGGLAVRSGLEAGDWIVALDWRPAPTVDEPPWHLAAVTIGVSIIVTARRGRDRIHGSVTPMETS